MCRTLLQYYLHYCSISFLTFKVDEQIYTQISSTICSVEAVYKNTGIRQIQVFHLSSEKSLCETGRGALFETVWRDLVLFGAVKQLSFGFW